MTEQINIRLVRPEDLDAVAAVEAACFPAAEAAGKKQFQERIAAFGKHFYVMECGEEIIGIIDGAVTNEMTISDEMFENVGLHREDGSWQSVFGLAVRPEFQHRGYAGMLMETLIAAAREEGRRGCILTCKDRLIAFYEQFGYKKLGVSASVHGGAVWYDMALTF